MLRFYHDTQIQQVTLVAIDPVAAQSPKLKGETSAGTTPVGGFMIAVLDDPDPVIEVLENNSVVFSDALSCCAELRQSPSRSHRTACTFGPRSALSSDIVEI